MKDNKELNDKTLEIVNGGNDQYDIQWHMFGKITQERQDKPL